MNQGLNMSEREKLSKGQARIQFVANSERIKELSAQGYDIYKIYCALREEQRLSMSYTSFYDNFTRRRKSRKNPAITQGSSGPPACRPPNDMAKPGSQPPSSAPQNRGVVDATASLRRLSEEQAQRQAPGSEYLQSTSKDVLNGNT